MAVCSEAVADVVFRIPRRLNKWGCWDRAHRFDIDIVFPNYVSPVHLMRIKPGPKAMFRKLFWITRAPGVALGLLILCNLLLTMDNIRLSVTRIWFDLQIPEPELSLISAVLGIALLIPHDIARANWARWLLGGIFFGFLILVSATMVGYYHALNSGSFATDLPVPFSLLVWLILLFEFSRISWCETREPRLPPPARCFFNGVVVLVSLFILICTHLVTFGRTDFRRSADAAVILGAKVYDDGSISRALRDRLDTGIELYRDGFVSCLIMSGGTGENGYSEPKRMAAYAREVGGVPSSRIILDEGGVNTVRSARNCGRIAREKGYRTLLTVSQYFHCARVKMIFERNGSSCYTVPTCSNERVKASGALARDTFFLLREAVAFPFYFFYYR